MKQVGLFAILSLAASAATAAVPSAEPQVERTTAKAVEPFARCFADAQDRASLPWWFVPKADGGGTFSNLGATGVRNPYFLDVADKGASREIRLSAASADPAVRGAVLRALDACV